MGHLGTDATSEPYRSTDVIENTNGIDAFIDAHSHSTIAQQTVQDEDGNDVLLTSTGTKFENFGKMTISADGTIKTELFTPESVDIDATASSQAAYDETQEIIEKYEEMQAFTYEEIGESEVDLTTVDPETGDRIIRNHETNMGNFVADAYRVTTGADIAFANGGGIRADVGKGTVTRKSLMDVNAFGNTMCVLEVTGQQILDALEWSAHAPINETGDGLAENGGFMHTSGLTYDINLHVTESPVLTDSQGSFTGIDSSKARRVQNVKVNGVAIDPNATYTLVGSAYTLQSGGDGYTMFKDAKVVEADCGKDQDLLIKYLQENLGGTIPAELYSNPYGTGRINLIAASDEEAHRYVETERVEATADKDGYVKYVCSICGEEMTETLKKPADETKPGDETTKPEDPSDIPGTGDTSAASLYFALLGVSIVAIVYIIMYKKDKPNKAGKH